MGGSKSVTKAKKLGNDWTLLEWSIWSGFSITMHTAGVRLRKVTVWIGHSETKNNHLSISWYETIPWGGIQAKGYPGQTVEYTYSS